MSYADAFTGLDEIPFAMGDVRGIRSWDVDQYGRLISPSFKTVWTPGENVAECKKKDDRYGQSAMLRAMGQMDAAAYRLSRQSIYYSGGGQLMPPSAAVSRGSGIFGRSRPSPAIYSPPPIPAIPTVSEAAVEQVKPKPHTQSGCACGFYAYSNGLNDYAATERLTGVIQGFGETQLGTRGFKCAKAKVLALYIPTPEDDVDQKFVSTPAHRFDRVAANYPDVKVFDNYARMVAEFPTYEQVPTPDSEPNFWDLPIQ